MGEANEDFQMFLDTQQYTRKGILTYEQIFGETYVSTGGQATTTKFCSRLNLKPDQKVLDIGCGIGGSAFHLARQYGAQIFGVDLSKNMLSIANENRKKMEASVQHRVQFHVDDATTMKYPDNFYDVVYSRDTILHIQDKLDLFKKCYATLKPGGALLVTDYCNGDKNLSDDFKNYVKQRGYNLHTTKEYGKILEQAGFSDVEAIDNTAYFIEILERELSEFRPKKDDIAKNFSLGDFNYICQGWEDKMARCKKGDQVWGYFYARKLFN